MFTLTFDSASVEADRQFDCFHEAIARQVLPVTLQRPNMAQGFETRVHSCRMATGGLHLIEAPSHTAARTPAHIKSHDPDELHLTYMIRGIRRLVTGETDTVFGPGELYLTSSRQAFTLPETTGTYCSLKIVFPLIGGLDIAESPLLRDPRRLTAHHPLSDTLRAACAALWQGREIRNDVSGGHSQKTDIPTLVSVVGALLASAARDAGAEPLAEAGNNLFSLIDLELERFRHDPGFTLQQLAANLGLSPRHIQRIMASHGSTFRETMREKRLQFAAQRLAGCSQGIDDIALSCGFTELSAFYRAFKTRFGMAPGEYRRISAEAAGIAA